jgi:UDP-glucose 4-epimerase
VQRVLITGANGFIGSHCVAHFERAGIAVVPIDVAPRSPERALLAVATPTVLMDVSDAAAVRRHCAESGVTHAVHLAYPTRDETPAQLETLLDGTRSVLDAARELGIRRVVFSSSGAIYGRLRKDDGAPIRENDPVHIFPTFLYRSAKTLGEWLGDFYAAQHGLDFVALRFATVYGPAQGWGVGEELKRGVLGRPCRPALTRGPLDDPIYVEDIARAVRIATLQEAVPSRSYNLAAARPCSNDDLAAAIRKALPDLAFEPGSMNAEQFHRQRDTLDVGLAQRELGFTPEYDLERGVAATAAWLLDVKERLS